MQVEGGKTSRQQEDAAGSLQEQASQPTVQSDQGNPESEDGGAKRPSFSYGFDDSGSDSDAEEGFQSPIQSRRPTLDAQIEGIMAQGDHSRQLLGVSTQQQGSRHHGKIETTKNEHGETDAEARKVAVREKIKQKIEEKKRKAQQQRVSSEGSEGKHVEVKQADLAARKLAVKQKIALLKLQGQPEQNQQQLPPRVIPKSLPDVSVHCVVDTTTPVPTRNT